MYNYFFEKSNKKSKSQKQRNWDVINFKQEHTVCLILVDNHRLLIADSTLDGGLFKSSNASMIIKSKMMS